MFADRSLYLVTGEDASSGRSTYHVVEKALAGGVDVIQMREKNLPEKELISLGRRLAALCAEHKALFIVNDNPFIARETGACGVHLGQEDVLKYPLAETRKILGENKIIGVSTHSYEQFIAVDISVADYIAFGPVFPTQTKDYFIGKKDVAKVLQASSKPVVFIGGINVSNIKELLSLGARNVAVIRAITRAEDIQRRVKLLKKIMKEYYEDSRYDNKS
jgi:thiamine-phosphate pyrophosphorylase